MTGASSGENSLWKMWLLFHRDFTVASSYRTAFLVEILQSLFGVSSFYFLSRFIESPQLDRALPQGGNYFSFALVGIAFFDYLTVALFSFDASLQSARQNGTLENLFVTQTSFPVILIGSAFYPFVVLALRTVTYLAWGVLLFGFPLGQANLLGALLILAASILAFSGLGILSASYLLVFKRGNPVAWAVLGISTVVSGMMYPVAVLPRPLRYVSRLIPVTYSLEGMRNALLAHATLSQLWPSLGALMAFAVILLPLSFLVLAAALRRTKITGTLTQF